MSHVGTVIRDARERKGWTQEDLAHEVRRRNPSVKLAASQLSTYERGAHTPRLPVLSAIAEALDEPLDSFSRPKTDDDEDEDSEMHRIAKLLESIGQIDLADELFARARRAKARKRDARSLA